MKTKDYAVEITVKGKPVPEVEHEGQTYIEGRSGSEYSLKFTNSTNHQLLFVLSIDGLSTVDGKRATEYSQGYIVRPNSVSIIPGWLVSSEVAAKFVFSDGKDNLPPSYVEEIGEDTNNIGWIGCMVYYPQRKTTNLDTWPKVEEYLKDFKKKNTPSTPWQTPPYNPPWGDDYIRFSSVNDQSTYSYTADTSGLRGSAIPKDVGTAFGDDVSFATTSSEFERDMTRGADIVTFYYNNLKNLKRLGVPTETLRPKKDKRPVITGSPFAQSFCKRPVR